MATPQSGIFALGTRSHYYLEFDLRPGAAPAALVEAVGRLREPRMTTGGANVVTGFRSATWVAAGGEAPPGCGDFEPVVGQSGFTMPASQHDLWVWVSGGGYDVVFDTARAISIALAETATLASEQPGFTYRDSLDLTGFKDGTANPSVDEAVMVASVRDGLAGEGGSVVLVQRWVHDLGSFHSLDVAQQEAVIGRTKDSDDEFDDQPERSHLSRVVIEDERGEEIEIFRRSASFGTLGEHGLVFVAFSADQERLAMMLARMAGAADGGRDRLTEFTTPTQGAFYFAPSIQALAALSAAA